MNAAANRRRRNLLIVVSVIIVAGAVLVVLGPRRSTDVVTVDGASRWKEPTAPPRRKVVWTTAEPMAALAAEHRSDHSHIRPQLAEEGTLLYFTIRRAGGDYDIYRSRLAAGRWQAAEPVAELNSPAADVGPIIRADGQRLYFYSDREGGFGGMDLYVSLRQGDRWSQPRNLGPRINSPAHEYDPAVSADGRQLFFASNRSPRTHRLMAEGTFDARRDHWRTTLRADLGLQKFDLYRAVRDRDDSQWTATEPLESLNLAESNEGAPYVSPDGAFLYFVSDRVVRDGEAVNFDVYRARLNRELSALENLGAGINTAANEIEPSLSNEGYRIYFSRNIGADEGDPQERYALFSSISREVDIESGWDHSRWRAVAAWVGEFLGNHWWWLVLVILLAALLAAFWWTIRHASWRRLPVPGFLLLALLVHLLLGVGSFFVYFGEEIVNIIRRQPKETIVATEVTLDSHQSHQPADQPYEKVADLTSPRTVKPTDLPRQVTEAPNVPLPPNTRVMEIPARLQAATSAPRIVAQMPLQSSPTPPVPVLERRRSESSPTAAEPISLEPMKSVARPNVELASEVAVKVTPQAVASPPSEAPSLARRPSTSVVPPLASDQSPVAMTEQLPTPAATVPSPLARSAYSKSRSAEESRVPLSALTVSRQAVVAAPSPQTSVDVQRQSPATVTPSEATRPPRLASAASSRPLEPSIDSSALIAANPTETPSSVQTESITLARADVAAPNPEGVVESAETVKLAAVAESSIGQADSDAAAVPSIEVALNHAGQREVPLVANPSLDIGGYHRPNQPRLILGNLDRERRDTPISSSPLRTRLLRRPARAAPTSYAEDNVNLRALLQRRKLDEKGKLELVRQFGGSDETLVAIRRGLSWIAAHQFPDGHWGLHDFHRCCKNHKQCGGHGNSRSDTAGTGLALLPFLGDGTTHLTGPDRDLVARGIRWLIVHQKDDGDLFTGGEGNAHMYSHGIAAIALCEAYGMSGDAALREPAQRAIDFIVAAQHEKSGGWRYAPRQDGDTSVVGWQVMALKSGQMAELNVPQKTLEGAQRWLESVSGKGGQQGQFAYQQGRYSPAMTAEGMLCMEYLGAERGSPHLRFGGDHLLKNLPAVGKESSYYWYYGTQAMFHLQGEHWRQWNDALHGALVETQIRDEPLAGTWDPRDQWEHSGGRLYATSLRLLMLEVYYRHLPLYQLLELE